MLNLAALVTWISSVVSWTLPSLAIGASTPVSFVVTATTAISNHTYAVRADNSVYAVGQPVVTTLIEPHPVTKYYYHGSSRIAMRQGSEVYFIHGDHLGSVSLTTDAGGALVAQARYLPYGQEHWRQGETRTDFGFTGQRNDGFGLMDYKARYYSPYPAPNN